MSQYSKGSFFVAAAYVSLMVCHIINANATDIASSTPTSANANNIVAMTNQNNQGAGQSLAIKIAGKIKSQFDKKTNTPQSTIAKQTASIKAGTKVSAQSIGQSSEKFAVKRQIPSRGKIAQVTKRVAEVSESVPKMKENGVRPQLKAANATGQQSSTTAKSSTVVSNKKQANSAGPTTDVTRVASYYKSTAGVKLPQASNEKMKIYSSPDKRAKIVSAIGVTENFTVQQGDWVRVKDAAGKEGWALISDVENNINEAWNAEFQVIINGPSSNYSVSKISPEERKQRQQKLRKAQAERMQKLAKLWESEFFSFNDDIDDNQSDQINDLRKQVLALNEQLKSMNTKEATQKKA